MLTKKELLNYKKQKNKIIPIFIDPQDELLIEFAQALCHLFAPTNEGMSYPSPIGKTRKELEGEFDAVLESFAISSQLALGLKKLCFDLFTFESLLCEQTSEFRAKVFSLSFACINEHALVEDFREQVVFHLNKNSNQSTIFDKEKLESFLYSDLPEFHKLTEIKQILPKQLLNKYNVSLVQGLLFYCSKIKIILPSVSNYKAQFRQLLKHIKFFQLIAFFSKQEDAVLVEMDGPLSLFVHTQKYGFNLACFFPALLFMPQWELSAQIEMGKQSKQTGELSLSHKTGLLSHYKNYSAYIPEEFSLFAESFAKIPNCEWSLNDQCDEILYDGDQYFFPDFEFIHENGTCVYMELFHSWHSAALKQRLFSLAKKPPSFILLLGVAKALLKDSFLSEEVQQFQYFLQYSFTFRDVVPTQKVLELLRQL